MRNAALSLLALFTLAACDSTPPSPERRGAPPPPAATVAASAAGAAAKPDCSRTEIDDPKTKAFFPAKSEGLYLDPKQPGASFGAEAKKPLEGVCDLFDGECQVYFDLGVRRVVELAYVDATGKAAGVGVIASEFDAPASAYAMFTKRTVGDADPAVPTSKPLEVPGAAGAAIGIGNAYLVKGSYLVELTYNDDAASEPELRASGERVLPALAAAITKALPGDGALPPSVALLPNEQRLPLGVRSVLKDALGVKGGGAMAMSYHRDGERRYRVLAAVHADEAAAKAAFAAFSALGGGEKQSELGDEAVRVTLKEGPLEAELVLARKGARLAGVVDELRVLRTGMTPEERGKLTTTGEAKRERVKQELAR
jgi:hypothetical protein